MRPHHCALSARDVTDHVVDRLATALAWDSPSPSAPATMVIRLLVHAAATMRSFFAAARDAARVPSAEALRKALRAMLPATPEAVLPAIVAALHRDLPKSLSGRPRDMAIDYHERPFYGRKGAPGTIRGRRKASTRTFFAYATLIVVDRGRTYTVGLVNLTKGREQADVIAELLGQAERAGLRPSRLLPDRGFYAATTIAWLAGRAIPFVMPMIRRGREAGGTGTTPFFGPGRSGWDSYTWAARPRRGGKKRAALGVEVEVCMAPRPGRAPPVFACRGMAGTGPAEVAALYRERFRIETSYRQLGQGLAATCSTDPAYRLLTAGLALVLRNVWVWLHETALGDRAGRRLERLRLRGMMSWLIHELGRVLGLRTRVEFAGPTPVGT